METKVEISAIAKLLRSRYTTIVAEILTILGFGFTIVTRILPTKTGSSGESSKHDTYFYIAVVLGFVFFAFFCILHHILRKDHRKACKEVEQLRASTNDLARQLDDGNRKLSHFADNHIRMIHPHEYFGILHNLAQDRGPGNLLLFNVELNSFIDNDMFCQLWERLAKLPEIRKVKLSLPPKKYERWKGIVTGDRAGFFSDKQNGEKFLACKYVEDPAHGEDRVAFALYESINTPHSHDWAVLFLINRPFVEIRNEGFCDYLHIVEYKGIHDLIARCRALWDKVFIPDQAETALLKQIVQRRRCNPTSIEELLEAHNCEGTRADELRRVVLAQREVAQGGESPSPSALCSLPRDRDGAARFSLRYSYINNNDNGQPEAIQGYCLGLPTKNKVESRPCIIWATGFGDGHKPKLAQLLSRTIRDKDSEVVEFFFSKSGTIRETTCKRLTQDLENILEYVVRVPEIDRNRIFVIGISICGFLAAKLAQKDDRIRGIILVAPPFDVIAMLDRLRSGVMSKSLYVPTFDDFLKGKNNLRISNWENRAKEFCNYFDQVVSVSHLLDLSVQGPLGFTRESLLEAMRDITTSSRPLALIYGNDDPIVQPEVNLPYVVRSVDAGHIQKAYFSSRKIPLAHFYPKSGASGDYPMFMADQREVVREMAGAIQDCMGIVLNVDNLHPDDESEAPKGLQITYGAAG